LFNEDDDVRHGAGLLRFNDLQAIDEPCLFTVCVDSGDGDFFSARLVL